MSHKLNAAIVVIGIDIGKNSFHVVGLDRRGAIVLRQKVSWPTSGPGISTRTRPGTHMAPATLASRSCAGWQPELTQGSAERNQFCRRGDEITALAQIPTRTM